MKNSIKQNKAITLIALVITIIVLLILAGVTISTLTGDNGLLQKVNEAKIATEEAKLEEEVQLALAEYDVDKHTNPQANLENNLKSIFERMHGTGNIIVSKSGKNYKVSVKNSRTTYRVRHTGEVEKYEEMDPTNVYAKLDESGILHLRATELEGYNSYSKSNSLGAENQGLVLKVVIEEPIAPQNMNDMFKDYSNLEKIEKIYNLHTENVTNMQYMFYGCNNLTELDVSRFDTSKVTNMAGTFMYCNSVTKLDINGFDTSSTTNMSCLFYECNLVESLEVKNFDTKNVTKMDCMFHGCNNLLNLDLSKFDTAKVNNMGWMFSSCSKLEKLVLGNKFLINENTNYADMFRNINNNVKIITIKDIADKLKVIHTRFKDNNFEIIN